MGADVCAMGRDLMEEIPAEDAVSISGLAVAVREVTRMAWGGDAHKMVE